MRLLWSLALAFVLAAAADRTTDAATMPNPTMPIAVASSVDACGPPDITVSSEFKREYYSVAGNTVDEISDSIQRNGPRTSDGEDATGLTTYSIEMSGRKCESTDSCSIGTMQLTVSGTITLPRIADTSTYNSAFVLVWDRFVDKVTVHEDRHVTIATEGAEELKRQLLDLGPMSCAALDSALDRVWRLQTEAIERRQAAFHTADAQGSGGLVVR